MELIINEDNFEKEVLQSDLPVMVDFYADWCVPCKMMAPVVEALAEEYEGKCKVGKCDVETSMELSTEYKVSSIPTIIIFKNGVIAARFNGGVSKKELINKIEQVLN